ncbi:MAG: hypothetical protein ACK50R_03465, partial [Planctomycetota bacterium]
AKLCAWAVSISVHQCPSAVSSAHQRSAVPISGHRGKTHASSLLVNVFLTIAIGVVWFVFGFHEDGMNCMNLHRAFMI